MTDEDDQPPPGSHNFGRADRVARIIRDLAVAPPAKEMASVKAASDVYAANTEGGGDKPASREGDDKKDGDDSARSEAPKRS